MNLTKDWYRSEFVDHEMITGHRILEKELSFYKGCSFSFSGIIVHIYHLHLGLEQKLLICLTGYIIIIIIRIINMPTYAHF